MPPLRAAISPRKSRLPSYLDFGDDENRIVAVGGEEGLDIKIRLPQARARVIPTDDPLTCCKQDFLRR